MSVIFGAVCSSIVAKKGYPKEKNHGFLWGFFLGVIGLIVCACKSEYSETQYYGARSNMISASEELRNYKALLDDGAITQEEYETKKRQLGYALTIMGSVHQDTVIVTEKLIALICCPATKKCCHGMTLTAVTML